VCLAQVRPKEKAKQLRLAARTAEPVGSGDKVPFPKDSRISCQKAAVFSSDDPTPPNTVSLNKTHHMETRVVLANRNRHNLGTSSSGQPVVISMSALFLGAISAQGDTDSCGADSTGGKHTYNGRGRKRIKRNAASRLYQESSVESCDSPTPP